MNEGRKEKLQFTYGFYKTYMNSLIYQLLDLHKMIAKKISQRFLRKQQMRTFFLMHKTAQKRICVHCRLNQLTKIGSAFHSYGLHFMINFHPRMYILKGAGTE